MRDAGNRKQEVGSSVCRIAAFLLLVLACVAPARAHVGSKDVFETITSGPYKLYVTIRMPSVIPGVATIEVQSTGAPIDNILIAPTLLTGEASKHPPTADTMTRSTTDPGAFSGTLWIMSSGSWEVHFTVSGAQGTANASVPVPAVPLLILPMQKPLGLLLAALGVVLMLGFAGLVAAAVRESRLPPGAAPTPERSRRGAWAFGLGLVLAVAAVWGGGYWWKVEAAAYADAVYRPSLMRAALNGNTLTLRLGNIDEKDKSWNRIDTAKLLLDHGKITHLYAIRWPQMDAAFHLHPSVVAKGELAEALPAMPPGDYRLFADIVYASGFPETLTATLTVPTGMPAAPLAADDASATPPALAAATLAPEYKLPDGYTLRWTAPASLTASKAHSFHFELLDPTGKPATDVQSYLGMAGHAAFIKTDGTVFAHTHPDGSAAMPAMMLANTSMLMADSIASTAPLPAAVDFPYGFPTPGRYRIFIQMKHGGTVETGVFDADVH